MPWDVDLNHDLHDKVRDYTCLSRFLKEDEHPDLWKQLFCLDNQRQMLDSYLRVLDPDTGVRCCAKQQEDCTGLHQMLG